MYEIGCSLCDNTIEAECQTSAYKKSQDAGWCYNVE